MRTAALFALLLWVVGSVLGYAFDGAIHLLPLAALLLFLIQRRREWKAASADAVSPGSILSIVMRREQEDMAPAVPDRWSLRYR